MQYLLALGDFAFTEDFVKSSPNSNLVWIIFIMATFLIQITILNMLIAIMGDAFAKVTEVKEKFGLKEKINIVSDFVFMVKVDNSLETRYIYSLKPKLAEDDLALQDVVQIMFL